jgi:hypothetical protein
VENLLSDLSFLRAEGFADEPRSDEAAGLEEPAYEALLRTGVSGDSPGERATPGSELRFALGSLVEDGHRLARGQQAGVLYRVDEHRIGDFPRDFFAYRFKALSSFVLSEIDTVELVFGAPGHSPQEPPENPLDDSLNRSPLRVRLKRDELGVWQASPMDLREGVASRLVAELARLEGISIVADAFGPEELAAVGLAPPRLILRAYEARPEAGGGAAVPVAEVHLGHADPERGIIARSAGRDTIYRIAPALSEQIPVDQEAFSTRFLPIPPPQTP